MAWTTRGRSGIPTAEPGGAHDLVARVRPHRIPDAFARREPYLPNWNDIEHVFDQHAGMAPPPRDHRPDDPDPTLASVLREVAELVAVDPAEVPDATKRDRVLALASLSGRLDAMLAREVGVFDANTVWAGDGARSASSWLQARSELAAKRCAGIVRTARDLRACPTVEAAWASGRLGTAKVTALLRARTVHPALFAECEAALVEETTPLTVTATEAHIARWTAIAEATRDAQAAADADGDPDDVPPVDPMAENCFHHSQTLDGRWLSDASYDPVTGAEIDEAIAAEIDARFAAGVYRADDGLTAAQRRAQCHHALITRGRNPSQTKHGDLRPTVSVDIDARTLAGIPITDAADAATRRCALANGTPVARSTIERLLCTCRLTAIATKLALDGTIEITGITDLIRDATPKQRKALKKRDGGCTFTGCSAPFEWCDAHHLWQHDLDGPTLLDNLLLLCKFHHHLVHEGGWHLWRDHRDGRLHLRKPDGTPVPIAQHGHKVPDEIPPDQPPPPRQRNGPPRHLTRQELAELDHRRRHRRQPEPPEPPGD
jgi:hypothetical protein